MLNLDFLLFVGLLGQLRTYKVVAHVLFVGQKKRLFVVPLSRLYSKI